MSDTAPGWPEGRSVDGGIDLVPVPGLTGRMWLCGKHAIAPDPDAVLARTGAGHVVCLTERHELEHRYPHYLTWLEQRRPAEATWLPIADLSAPPLAEFAALVDALHLRLHRGVDVVVHCAACIGRAGTVATGVVGRHGLALPVAGAVVARHRPMAGPEAGAQAAVLADYAASLAPQAPPDVRSG